MTSVCANVLGPACNAVATAGRIARPAFDTLRELANRFASSRLTFPNSATSYGRGGGVGRGRGAGVVRGGTVGVGVGLPAGNWNLPTRVDQLIPVVT